MTKIMRLLAFVASMALLVAVAPTATANHSAGWPNGNHEDPPIKQVAANVDPLSVGNCEVDGLVETYGDGLNQGKPEVKGGTSGMVPSHGHYAFRDASLVCEGGRRPGTYIVAAWGGADGPLQAHPDTGVLKHGSTTALSWSHSGGAPGGPGTSKASPGGGFNHGGPCGITVRTNQNSITATLNGVTSVGWVKFIRVGPDAEAWGQFCNGPLGGLKFIAELVFAPVPTGAVDPPFVENVFTLDGAAVTFCGDFVPGEPNKPKQSGLAACP